MVQNKLIRFTFKIVSVLSVSWISTMAPASADVSSLALAAEDCGSATAQLQSAETAYRNAQKQLSQAQQRCKGDFNCVYPYQTALARAQATLEAARDTVDKVCK